MIALFSLLFLLAAPWEEHYSQGRALAQKQDWKRAEAEFRQVLNERPDFLPARLALGTVLEQSGDWGRAETEFQAAIRTDPKSFYALTQLAQSLMNLKRGAEAVPYWERARELEPNNPDAPIGLAAALFDLEKFQEAQTILQELVTAQPSSAAAHSSLANYYAHRGLFAEAVAAYQDCLKLEPGRDEARLAMVKALLALDRHNEALDALKPRPEDFETLLLRGAALRGLGEDERAVVHLAAAVGLKSGDYDARYNLGFVLSRLGRYREAKEQLIVAAQLRPESNEAHYRLALVLRKLGDNLRADQELRLFERKKKEGLQQTISANSLARANERLAKGDSAGAISEYQDALRRDSSNALAHNQLGLLLLGKGQATGAESEFKAGLAADPKCAECSSNLGVIYGQRGDSNRAEAMFRAALAINPRYGEARLNLGLMLAGKGLYPEAERELQLVPATAKSLTALGMVQTKLNKPEAVETFKKVEALEPRSAEARLNVGIALADAGKLDEALVEFTEALRLEPGSASAHYNRGRVLRDLGRLNEAASELDAADSIPQALFLHATVEQQLAHHDRAASLLRRVIAAEPANTRACFALGQNLQRSGKDEEAIAAWKQCLQIDHNHAESLYALFRALAKSSPEEAKGYGARFTSLKKQDQAVSRAETLSNFAIASAAARDWGKAIAQLREALQICGQCISKADLYKNLGLIECQSGNLQSGEHDLQIALKDKPEDADIQKALKTVSDLLRAPAR